MIPIHLRNVPPPMETFDVQEFLSLMAKWIKPECYLELGVRYGDVFFSVAPHCKICCGVDIDMSNIKYPKKENMILIQQNTDDFFKSLEPDVIFDMIFIDADHNHTSVLKDFTNASKHIIDDGFIFLHDTYPYNEEMIKPHFSSDCYKTPLYIKQNLIDTFEIITLPFNPGLTIIKKMNREKQLLFL